MNAPSDIASHDALRLAQQVADACARIAPTWPLDQFIAVNAYWGWVGQPAQQAAAQLGVLAGTRLTMPRTWFHQEWQAGRLQHQDLAAVAASSHECDELVSALSFAAASRSDECAVAVNPRRLPLVTDLRDAGPPPRAGTTWTELVTHQLSQHAAAWFDEHQATWLLDREAGFFGSWRSQLLQDRAIPWRAGRNWLRQTMTSLADDPMSAIAGALKALGIPAHGAEAYLTAVLMSMQGWAAWCAYQRWQARLQSGDDDQIVALLAARVVWEQLLWADHSGLAPRGALGHWASADTAAARLQTAQRIDWRLQQALEHAYQRPLLHGLARPAAATVPDTARDTPKAQAVFCIDVRSEVFRRALESVEPQVHTRGFAGFFGLPIAYAPAGSALVRPQLPGLLAPAVCVTDEPLEPTAAADAANAAAAQANGMALGSALARRRRAALQSQQRWRDFRCAPASAFSAVETLGLLSAAELLRASLPGTALPPAPDHAGLNTQDAASLKPCLPDARRNPAAAAQMAHGILTAMGLVRGFAPLVLLAGHGSQTANNPHAAGLDCGACGGQTGEVNARVLADLLNQAAVRQALQGLGITIPASTWFVAALHNTTTDQVLLFDTDILPAAFRQPVSDLEAVLRRAGDAARAERAASLGLASPGAAAWGGAAALRDAITRRANDWAQVRPEWGLANCAAFIVAPRQRTRHLDLQGRVFLHDYDTTLDPSLAVLTLIMTAPMVVTNWINQQYHASTVDNPRYGSGNKLLHNVVGGRIGVFEGNGGDLRIGLPLQSLHDGTQWMHTPLRLSVFIEAPAAHIDQVIAAHPLVKDLVQNEWLHLFQIEPRGTAVQRWTAQAWVAAETGG